MVEKPSSPVLGCLLSFSTPPISIGLKQGQMLGFMAGSGMRLQNSEPSSFWSRRFLVASGLEPWVFDQKGPQSGGQMDAPWGDSMAAAEC